MNTLDALKQLLHDQFGFDTATLDPAAPLVDYGLDSLSLAELMFTVEDHFDIEFPPDRQDLPTLAAIVDVIDGLKLAKAA